MVKESNSNKRKITKENRIFPPYMYKSFLGYITIIDLKQTNKQIHYKKKKIKINALGRKQNDRPWHHCSEPACIFQLGSFINAVSKYVNMRKNTPYVHTYTFMKFSQCLHLQSSAHLSQILIPVCNALHHLFRFKSCISFLVHLQQ